MTSRVRDVLTTAWQALAGGSSGDREWRALRIELTHRLQVFAAVREADGTRGVLFECPIANSPTWRLRFESEGLHLTDDRDGRNGSRRITLALERSDLDAVFLVIADDLIESSRMAGNDHDAVATLGAKLAAWQTCLKLRREGFGQERMLGLYGELAILDLLSSAVGTARAIEVWSGPERGLRDFEAGPLAIEVKTSLGASGAVRIGSLDQLDPRGLHRLTLCRVVVVPDDAGVGLVDLVERVRAAASAAGPGIRTVLDQRLLMSGYIGAGERDAPFEPLSILTIESYDVCGDFPRVTRETVPAAVLSAEYRLYLGTASRNMLTEQEFRELLMSFGVGG
ncbi:PD-(D/E)XK motif protein [Rubrivivax gelatinosus]|uniref:PD-(D/E)XK motif protein n=1 Tax=Rubrivivax gelatinosus TaxID=28068 RepID=UPI0012FD9C62|nr:PD-(D/E)XK motif protein [Rubrivivax gelatinosus]MBG6080832.1 hypothetical protein [Rubrivivax gelatinosus]